MAAPYDMAPPPNAYMARQMMNQNIPLNAVQMNNPNPMLAGGMPPGAMGPPTMVPRGPMLSPPGVPFGPGVPAGPNVPNGPGGAAMMPGMLPGMLPTGGIQPANMPMGGGVINANIPPGRMPPGGIVQAQMAQANAAAGAMFQGQRTQIRFVRPSGMKVSWFTQGPDGRPTFSTTPVEAPGRYNFPQAAIYRLKLSNIEGRPGLEVYPTMEVVPCNPKTAAFLAHSAVPIDFTNEDFKQIADGNYLVKVIYLPDPQFQDVAGTGTDEILSTRLDPGADPIQEALRRGSILVVLRMGNVDQEAPNTPPLNAPGPHATMPNPQMGGPQIMAQQQMMAQQQAMGMGQPGMGPNGQPAIPIPPWALKTSAPRGQTGVPGFSSTNKFQNAPPTSPSIPQMPDTVGPSVPQPFTAPAESQVTPSATPQAKEPEFPAPPVTEGSVAPKK